MADDPTVWMMNATAQPQDVRVGKSIATVLPGERIKVYDDLSPFEDRAAALLARGFVPSVAP
jgi:hypothetical protein